MKNWRSHSSKASILLTAQSGRGTLARTGLEERRTPARANIARMVLRCMMRKGWREVGDVGEEIENDTSRQGKPKRLPGEMTQK